jgi:hypothetical protein
MRARLFIVVDSKGKAKGGKRAKQKLRQLMVIAKVFSHAEFKTWCEKIQTSYDDAEKNPYPRRVRAQLLESEGYEITE